MTASELNTTNEILHEVLSEREKQNDKWGVQNHPMGTNSIYAEVAESYKNTCNRKAKNGSVTWLDILLEEVFEAAAENDDEHGKLRIELIQVAAVAVNMIENLDRNVSKNKTQS